VSVSSTPSIPHPNNPKVAVDAIASARIIIFMFLSFFPSSLAWGPPVEERAGVSLCATEVPRRERAARLAVPPPRPLEKREHFKA
jgi:hypothetical protein